MLIDIVVVPNSPKFKIVKKDRIVKAYLTAQPEKNKANIELLRELENLFGKQSAPVLVSGAKSKRKRIELQISEEEWDKFVFQV